MDDRNSVWNVIKRFFNGGVAFVAEKTDADKADHDPPRPDPLHDAKGNLIQPELELKHHIEHVKYDDMVLSLDLTNNSSVCVQIRRISILGSSEIHDLIIGPGETKQVEAYRGEIPHDNNQHYLTINYCELYSGVANTFDNHYFIKFKPYHDKFHYLVTGLSRVT